MKSVSHKRALGLVLIAGAMTMAAGAASARIVCNAQGDCWHTDSRVSYGQRLEAHPDDWYFHQKWDQNAKRHWRDYHEGRGYYANGVWVQR
ncbi:MAG: hypothetical protein E7812_03815 [Phenylobacterium sp.]|nr:MAG: hypothetical protein E7812_03815 [Phenylobacterium sp.]